MQARSTLAARQSLGLRRLRLSAFANCRALIELAKHREPNAKGYPATTRLGSLPLTEVLTGNTTNVRRRETYEVGSSHKQLVQLYCGLAFFMLDGWPIGP